MKRIAFVSQKEITDHYVRGIGFYVQNLLPEIQSLAKKIDIEVVEISNTQKVSEKDYSIVHYPFLDIFYPTLPLVSKVNRIVTIHDLIPLEYPNVYKTGIKSKINFIHQYLSVKRCNAIITDSNYSAESIHKHFNTPRSKINVIYLAGANKFNIGDDTKKNSLIKKKYNLPSKFILYVGDINYTKNIQSLIQVCVQNKINLILVGKALTNIENIDLNHPEHIHLKNIIPFLSSAYVKRLGFVPDEDLPFIYKAATLYCQPSFAEGFGMPILEAMKSKTPVLVSDALAVSEIMGAKMSKYQFNPKDMNDMQRKIDLLWNSESERKTNIDLCIEREKNFSWQATAKQTLEVYKKLL